MVFKKQSIPNFFTIFRILLVPIIVVLLLMSSADIYHINFNGTTYSFSITNVIAALCFVLACLTDALDGYLARRNQ
jgi:CDP-diacylglycerol--glycerol-3-phosphate 3-phosphatidyltransferase